MSNCTTHHNACDCREVEFKTKLAEKDAEINRLVFELDKSRDSHVRRIDDAEAKLAEKDAEIERLKEQGKTLWHSRSEVVKTVERVDRDNHFLRLEKKDLTQKLAEAEARVEEEEQAYVTMMDLRDAEIRKRTQAEERALEMRQFIEDCECECVEANHVTGLMTKRVCARCETLSAAPASQPSRMEKLEAVAEAARSIDEYRKAVLAGETRTVSPFEMILMDRTHKALSALDATDSEKAPGSNSLR